MHTIILMLKQDIQCSHAEFHQNFPIASAIATQVVLALMCLLIRLRYMTCILMHTLYNIGYREMGLIGEIRQPQLLVCPAWADSKIFSGCLS